MGAFPIQTNPGGANNEWIEDGVNGLSVPYDDPVAIAEAIKRALQDDELVDNAATINHKLTSERIDEIIVRTKVIDAYEQVYMESAGGK